MNEYLNTELSKRILCSVGAVPGPNFGAVGITTDNHLISEVIKTTDDNKIFQHNIWAGEIVLGESTYRLLLTNIEDENNLLISSYDTIFGVKIDYSDYIGDIIVYNEELRSWQETSVLKKLQITTAFEIIMQEGILWEPLSVPLETLGLMEIFKTLVGT